MALFQVLFLGQKGSSDISAEVDFVLQHGDKMLPVG